MKVVPFVISLGLTIALIVIATLGIWKDSNTPQPLKLSIQKLEVPDSGRYIPRNAYLTIHFNIDPNQIPKYIASLSKGTKKDLALSKGKAFRNGLFALVGLDFEQDISNWISPRFSLSILNNGTLPNEKGWLMAIQGINNDATKVFLNSYWEKQVSNGLDIQEEELEGHYIIHEKEEDRNNDYKSIAMSLLENNILIIASDNQIIKKAIIASNDSNANQYYDEELKDTIDHLENGSAIITSSSEALQSFFQIPPLVVEKIKPSGFAATIKAEGRQIFLDSYFKSNDKISSMITMADNNLISSEYKDLALDNIAIIRKPQKLIDIEKADIYSKWIGDILKKSLLDIQSPISNIIVEMEKDKLIIGTNNKSWLIGVPGDETLSKIDSELANKDFNKSIVNLQDKIITVWSKLIAKSEESIYQLLPQIEIILYQKPNINFWTNDISMLQKINSGEESKQQSNQLDRIGARPDIEITQEVSLGEDSAQRILNNWKPWQIIKTVTSSASTLKVNRLELNFGEDIQKEQSALYLRGMLSIN